MGQSKIDLIPTETFKAYVESSYSYLELLEKIGLSWGTKTVSKLEKRLIKEGLVCKKGGKGSPKRKKLRTNVEKFTSNIGYVSSSALKAYLLRESLLKERCYRCGQSNRFFGDTLVLQLDHIDGDNKNNSLDNLWLLCPNCHTQTVTYAGKNTNLRNSYKAIIWAFKEAGLFVNFERENTCV